MSEHTKTPWKVDKWLGSKSYQWVIAYDAGDKGRGISIAETVGGTGKEKANAKHIVHCVNNNERLVEALRELLDKYEDVDLSEPEPKELTTAVRVARTLLAELDAGEGGEG